MKPTLRRVLYAAFIVGTLLIVLLVALKSGDLPAAMAAIGNMSMGYAALGVLCAFGSIFAQALSAGSAIASMGHRIPLPELFAIAIVEKFYCFITPSASGGQPMAIYQIHKRGVPVSDATSALLIHRLCFQLSLVTLMTAMGIVCRSFILEHVGENLPVLVFGYAFNVLYFAGLCLLCFTRRPVRWIIEGLARLGRRLRIRWLVEKREAALATAERFHVAMRAEHRDVPELLRQLFFGLMRVCLWMSVMYCVYRGLGFSECGYWSLFAMSLMQYASAAYTPLPGASGAQEGVFGLYFDTILPGSLLFSGMLAWRFITYYLVLIVGAVVTLVLGAHRRQSTGYSE